MMDALAGVFVGADPAALDCARMWFPSTSVHAVVEGRAVRPPRAPPPPPPKPRPVYSDTLPPDQRWGRFVEHQLAGMYRGLDAGPGGRHTVVRRFVRTIAGLSTGAGAGYPDREAIVDQVVAAWVAAGEDESVARYQVRHLWRWGAAKPFYPEERVR